MRLAGLGTALLLTTLAGCTCATFAGYRSDVTHRYQACRAWHRHSHDCDPGDYPRHFAAGWKEGYLVITSGGNGDLPPVPPEEYWKDRFRTPEGRGQVDAWFAGYQCGVVAAEKDGMGTFAHIPVGPGVYEPLPPTWQPGEWKQTQPEPEQIPDAASDDGMVRRPLEPRLAEAPRQNTPPIATTEGPRQPVAPMPQVAPRPTPSNKVIGQQPPSGQNDQAQVAPLPVRQPAPVPAAVQPLPTAPVPAEAAANENHASPARDQAQAAPPQKTPAAKLNPPATAPVATAPPATAPVAAAPVAAAPVPSKTPAAQQNEPEQQAKAKTAEPIPQVSMRRAPRKAPVADRETAAEKKEAAEVPAARMSVPHGDTPEIPRVTVRVKPSETASDEKPVSSRNNSPNAADRPHPSASTETARVTLRVGPGERTNTKESAASERDQASAGAADEKTEPQTASEMPDVAAGKANKQDSVKPATLKRYRGKSSIAQQPIPPAAPAPVAGVGVLIDDGAKSAGKDFLGNDREQAKVSFDERPMPEVSPTSTPRVAVRLIPASESLDSASAPPSGNQRTSVPSSEAPARLKLTSGPENQSSNATRSTLKIVNAGQVDSRRPEKSE